MMSNQAACHLPLFTLSSLPVSPLIWFCGTFHPLLRSAVNKANSLVHFQVFQPWKLCPQRGRLVRPVIYRSQSSSSRRVYTLGTRHTNRLGYLYVRWSECRILCRCYTSSVLNLRSKVPVSCSKYGDELSGSSSQECCRCRQTKEFNETAHHKLEAICVEAAPPQLVSLPHS